MPRTALVVIDSLDLSKAARPRRSRATVRQERLERQASLFIDGDTVTRRLRRTPRQPAGVNMLPAAGANVYDILKHDTLVLTRAAVAKLEARFNG
jgi:large subunit ribosomal protein L4